MIIKDKVGYNYLCVTCMPWNQGLKANVEAAPTDLKLNSNYITRFGQVALSEAVDMIFELTKGKGLTVHF